MIEMSEAETRAMECNQILQLQKMMIEKDKTIQAMTKQIQELVNVVKKLRNQLMYVDTVQGPQQADLAAAEIKNELIEQGVKVINCIKLNPKKETSLSYLITTDREKNIGNVKKIENVGHIIKAK